MNAGQERQGVGFAVEHGDEGVGGEEVVEDSVVARQEAAKDWRARKNEVG